MDDTWRTILWQQFGASIEMLENALRACPDELWDDRSQKPEYWYLVYHTLFWLDLYLSGSVEGFTPPAPFTLDELDPAGLLPERVYAKDELQIYLEHCREQCQTKIATLTQEKAGGRSVFRWGEISFLELLLCESGVEMTDKPVKLIECSYHGDSTDSTVCACLPHLRYSI